MSRPRPSPHARWTGGFSMPELVASAGLIGVLATVALPMGLNYLPAAQARSGAREIQAVLMQARMVAISTRQPICAQPVTGGYQYLQGGCGGVAWIGASTNASGIAMVSNDVIASGPAPVFTPFGTASVPSVISVSHGAQTLTVTVQPSGQVTIP
ncbi:MAG TPA: GspH/FimT family pseudopilin [Methylomirabilota bacterium]|nr:GspH/FimT family pseudopilin [Methylomirabilota bacterium]